MCSPVWQALVSGQPLPRRLGARVTLYGRHFKIGGGVIVTLFPCWWGRKSRLSSQLSSCQKELVILLTFSAPSQFHCPRSGLSPVSSELSQGSPNLSSILGHWAFPGHCLNSCLVICLENRSWHTTPWLNPPLAP